MWQLWKSNILMYTYENRIIRYGIQLSVHNKCSLHMDMSTLKWYTLYIIKSCIQQLIQHTTSSTVNCILFVPCFTWVHCIFLGPLALGFPFYHLHHSYIKFKVNCIWNIIYMVQGVVYFLESEQYNYSVLQQYPYIQFCTI
jgi:hypothetical protein